ncbi:Nramp family divalent metal transporter [Raineyella sp. W15-4]|uniref:Nramp family divalent metal transporter n=1 Tax=Raineyella sp. W15-4 TaxID=3081651 RepID=UPI0029535A2B|nr:Nramp family divalent metal transporter [Raineyella sp. W15-4]WOQ17538.1 Nramp family divalent metal transporter [Raineyella sp. W15-4]
MASKVKTATEEQSIGNGAATAGVGRWRRMAMSAAALAAVVGPGLIAGLSDDDPAGITTYSSLGASYGYQLLWVLVVSTVALILFQDLGARIGVVTGQGLAGLIRQRYGARAGVLSIAALVVANIGTTTAEFAGVAAGTEIFGLSRYISVPIAAIAVSALVLRGGFRGVERVLIVLSAVFIAYIGAGILARPDWGAALQGMVVPAMPLTKDSILITTATLGTTLAPWGLAFIQSYAVDKKLGTKELGLLRIDVVTGAILTGVIGFFVVVACAATMYAHGIQITDAASAAVALEPLAGPMAEALFAVGLLGAALLAASILPLSTAYSVCDVAGRPAALDDTPREAPLFYGTFATVTVIGVVLVLLPGVSLVPILVLTQVLNAVLLLPLLAYMAGIARDRRLMGEYVAGRAVTSVYYVVIALVVVCILAMLWLTFIGG